MAGGAVDSPAGGSGGGQKNKDKQSIMAVNIKQVDISYSVRLAEIVGDRQCRVLHATEGTR